MAAPKLPTRLDLGDVENSSERVMPGTYHAKVAKAELKENKAKDGHYFNVELIITSEGPAKGRHIWEILPLKKAALWKLKGFLAACEIEDDNPAVAEIPEMIEGSDVDIVVGEEDYQGEPQARIRKVKPSTAPSMGDLAAAAEVDEDVEEDAVEEEDDADDEPYTEDELVEFELAELKEIAKDDFGITIKRGMKKDALVAAILEAQEPEDEEPEDEVEEEVVDEDDDLFEDDEEEAPKPARRRVRK
jgi:hypothetical protein